MTRDWELPEDLTASAFARARVREALTGIGLTDEVLEEAELIASELAANAVRYGNTPYALHIEAAPSRVRISVSNHGSTEDPRLIDAEIYSHHGRGLAIVEALADSLGWARDGDRLDVWADLRVAPSSD